MNTSTTSENELVSVFTVPDPVTAEIVKNFLHSEGIRCFVDGENQAGVQGLSSLEIGLLVPADQADLARKLLEAYGPHKKGAAQHPWATPHRTDIDPTC